MGLFFFIGQTGWSMSGHSFWRSGQAGLHFLSPAIAVGSDRSLTVEPGACAFCHAHIPCFSYLHKWHQKAVCKAQLLFLVTQYSLVHFCVNDVIF